MATVLGDRQRDAGIDAHGGWSRFSESERQRMLRDDIRAGTTVSMILTAVIVTGLVIGLVGVLLSL